jgi:hypothetical protein
MSANQPPISSNPSDQQPPLIRNAVSLLGAVLATISAANIIFLLLVSFLSARPSPYIGVFAFMVFPVFLVIGLLLIPIGMLVERRRRRRLAPSLPRYPSIDFNIPAQRNAFAFFISFSALFVVLTAVGSYRAYEFTDSVQFCGQLCHTVMNPEFTTYTHSPHARVRCVDCHVGPGAGWYVKSKLSGAYQVYAAIFHKYPRPIPTPVANLRPAQETCEQCHWPAKFYGAQLKVFYHYEPDEKNTPRQVRMLINTGGGQPFEGMPTGIHWHMNIANKITYIATDAQRQVIPWVQVQDRQGRITVYEAKDSPLKPEQIRTMPRRVMDCVDCHDRPSHIFTPPDLSVDQAMMAGKVDPSLPYIKQQGVAALTGKYNSTDQALKSIADDISNFYQSKYPVLYASQRPAIDQSVRQLQSIYSNTFFPYMKVDWRTHVNNIGHLYAPGCFRCHDGQHVGVDGKVVGKDCNTCHTMLSETVSGVPLMKNEQGTPFQHPVDIGDLTQVNCSDCHTGGTGP